MSKITFALIIALVLSAFGCASPSGEPGVNTVQVNQGALAELAPEDYYQVDLLSDTVWEISPDADMNRIMVLDEAQSTLLADWLDARGLLSESDALGTLKLSGNPMSMLSQPVSEEPVGAAQEELLFAQSYGGSLATFAPTYNYECTATTCSCTGDVDCNDMFTHDCFGPWAQCWIWGGGVSCYCER